MNSLYKIKILHDLKFMCIDTKPENKTKLNGFLLLAITRLEKRAIDLIILNNNVYFREDFEFKNGKFNNSRAIKVLVWSYHHELLERLCN